MKTHDLAKALLHLSRVLRAGPNIELNELVNLNTYASSAPKPQRNAREMADRGAALALLAQIANYNKREMIELAEYLEIPIETRNADAVRDVLGKILKYIQENPGVSERLVKKTNEKETGASPILARALSILLNQT